MFFSVLDDLLSAKAGFFEGEHESLTSARAAVAELILDMEKIKDAARLGIRYHSIGPGYTEEIERIAKAALERIGATP